MIYFIDEDVIQIKPFVLELELRGHDVEIISNADKAFIKFKDNDFADVELIIIDVMLAVEPNEHKSIFTRIETDDFKITGIILLQRLKDQNPKIFPSKALFFTMATSPELLTTVKAACQKYSVKMLHKSEFPTPYEFGEEVEKHLRKMVTI